MLPTLVRCRRERRVILRMSFTEPAAHWAEAMPVGNGRLGAMVHGGLTKERIGLNEDTFWSGPVNGGRPTVPAGLMAQVETLVRAGQHRAADEALRALQYGDAEAYQPIGDLEITFSERPARYRRGLDLSGGVAYVQRDACRQEVLASAVHQILAVRLATDAPAGFSARLALTTPQSDHEIRASERGLEMSLAAPRHIIAYPRTAQVIPSDDTSIRAGVVVRLTEVDGGRVRVDDSSLILDGMRSVTILVAIRTSFERWNVSPTADVETCLARARADLDAADVGWAILK